jgi:hypothetical protein
LEVAGTHFEHAKLLQPRNGDFFFLFNWSIPCIMIAMKNLDGPASELCKKIRKIDDTKI